MGSDISTIYPIIKAHKGHGRLVPMIISCFMMRDRQGHVGVSAYPSIEGSQDEDQISGLPGGIELDLKAKTRTTFTSQQISAITKNVLGSFDVSQLKMLEILDLPCFDKTALLNFYQLEELTLQGESNYDIVRGLQDLYLQDQGQSPLVPRLLKLRLCIVDFDVYKDVRDTLMMRSWHRCPIETVCIETCTGFSKKRLAL